MNITIIAVGSRGDVQPYVALGLGLRTAGHQVTIATHRTFESFVRRRGLYFASLQANPRILLEGEAARMWTEAGSNPLKFFRGLAQVTDLIQEQLFRDTWQACQNAAVILFSPLGYAGYHVAERLGLPSFPAFYMPTSRTRMFPSLMLPSRLRLGQRYNRLTYWVTERLLWLAIQTSVNRWRQQVLELPPIRGNWFDQLHSSGHPMLYGFSPTVVPPPDDWPAQHHVTGYWFLDHPYEWQPPLDLMQFLEAGAPPVYVGFGSMIDVDAITCTELVLQALQRTQQRGILLTGWGGLKATDLPKHVFLVHDIPHDWLFPQVAAVVHHGGAGTTAAGLRAGIPAVIVPFFADQPFWGQRVVDLGVSPATIPKKHLSIGRLAEAIDIAVNDTRMQRRAREIGRQIRRECGIQRAINVLHTHLAVSTAS